MTEGKGGTKGRILFLAHFLMEHTDDQNSITAEDLILACKEQGYTANRNTIRDDIAILNGSYMDIMAEREGKSKTFHVGTRLFEIVELKMLVDAVSSCRFITREKSDGLIDKIARLTSVQNRRFLYPKVFSPDYIKSETIGIFVTADKIREATEKRRKLAFHYLDYTPEKKRVLRNNGELYVASPYSLIWNDDRYYLAAYSEKRQKIVTFRVDRMCDVKILDEDAIQDETFNPAEYASRTMKMFDGDVDETDVILQCRNQYMQSIIDRFGESIHTEILDNENFIAKVTVRPSKTFFSWVFQFLGEIKLLSPEPVRIEYEKQLRTVLKKQEALGPESPSENQP